MHRSLTDNLELDSTSDAPTRTPFSQLAAGQTGTSLSLSCARHSSVSILVAVLYPLFTLGEAKARQL